MEFASDEVLELPIRRGVHISQTVDLRVDTWPALVLADNKCKVEYELIVVIKFK